MPYFCDFQNRTELSSFGHGSDKVVYSTNPSGQVPEAEVNVPYLTYFKSLVDQWRTDEQEEFPSRVLV